MNAPESSIENVQRPVSIEWEAHREIISRLYRDGHTQTKIRNILASEYGFDVSPKQLEYRLKLWHQRKNFKQTEYQHIQQNLQQYTDSEEIGGNTTTIFVDGRQVPTERLKRNVYRPIQKKQRIDPTFLEAERQSTLAQAPDVEIHGSPNERLVSNSRVTINLVPESYSQTSKRRRQVSTPTSDSEDDAQPTIRALPVSSFACPFAKARPRDYPSCIPIRRQNLAGIKEHLKRRHFKSQTGEHSFNRDSRELKTWEDLFLYALPGWEGHIPNPEFDMLDTYREATRSPTRLVSYNTPSSTQRAGYSPSDDETYDTAEGEDLEEMNPVINRASRQEKTRASQRVESIGIANSSMTPAVSPRALIQRIDRMGEIIENVHSSYSAVPVEARNSSPRPVTRPPLSTLHHNSNEHVPDQSTTVSRSSDRAAANNPSSYLLRVARKPAPRNSVLESPKPKKLYFNDFHDFEEKFEPWMKQSFRDPPFSWETWALEDARRKTIISGVGDVRDELEFMFDAHESKTAALYLIPR